MNETEVFKEFTDAGAILKGHFILSSGLHSDTYLQCARVLMDGKRADRLCSALAVKIRQQLTGIQFDMVVAPAMGGVVVGYEMGRQLGIPSIFCERENGAFTFRRGFAVEPGSKILVVEDVVTTAKSSLETIECIQAQGGVVVAEASLIDRGEGAKNLPVPLVSLMKLSVPVYQPDALPAHLKDVPAVKPGSRFLKK
ncbi:MAG TPA: orotate phosphoribosyltransferase [Rickettsiales bacterium]|nr:orotate phosphoribosyltransferase [Rickettsiales bacterium]